MTDSETTWEEASKCPKCGKPGRDGGIRPTARPGTKAHLLYCMNQLCLWYEKGDNGEPWLVQVNRDGSIPPPNTTGQKQFMPVSQESETRIHEALERQLRAETSGEGEIRNPYS